MQRIDIDRGSPGRHGRRSLLQISVLALLLPLGVGGCGEGDGLPVARVEVTPAQLTLPYGGFRDVRVDLAMTSALEGSTGQPLLFVHLLDEEGSLVRTFDRPIPGGWSAGDERGLSVRVYQSVFAPPLPPGEYTLTLGVYDREGNRWPLEVAAGGARVDRGEYEVARVSVPSGPSDLPAIEFSPTWSPTLAGGDRQVLATRWLTGDGSIRLAEIAAPGTLWLSLRIPEPGAGGAEILLRGDRTGGEETGGSGPESPGERREVPGLRVSSRCSGFRASVSGAGHHDVEVPVAPSEDGTCAVRVEPSYRRVLDGMEERTVLLEIMAWREGR